MIPLKLQLKNFLSYGSEFQDINFDPYNLICLSGKNGHGKSALLDAMTWAIWGQARKTTGTAKPDQGLLRLGQRQMSVIFDFQFNGNKYRVRREFTFAYGKPSTQLEFGMFEGEDNLIPLTDKTIKVTQEKIESMLGLDYESFINSAFLRQGSSNEFSQKSPKDRKEILANILGLNKYENLRKLALEKSKQATIEKDSINKLQERLESELATSDQIKEKKLILQEELKKIESEEKDLITIKNKLEDTKKNIIIKQQEFQVFSYQQNNKKEEFDKNIVQLKELRFQWKDAHKKLLCASDQKLLEAEKSKLQSIISDYQKKLETTLKLKEEYFVLRDQEQKIARSIQDEFAKKIQDKKSELDRLTNQEKFLADQLKTWLTTQKEFSAEKAKIDKELKDLKSSISKDSVNQQNLEKIEKQFEKRRTFYQSLVAQGNWIKNEINALEQKKKLSLDEENPSCPLCEQNLSASRKRFLKTQLLKQEQFLQHRLNRVSKLLQKLKEILLNQHEDLKKQKELLDQTKIALVKIEEFNKSCQKTDQQLEEVKNKIDNAEKEKHSYSEKIEKLTKELINLQDNKALDENKEYQELKNKIEKISKEIVSINYDQTLHKECIEKLQNLENLIKDQSSLSQERILQEQRKKEISNLCKLLKSLKINIKEIGTKLAVYRDLPNEEEQLLKQEEVLNISTQDLSKKKQNLLQEKASLETQLKKLDQVAQELKEQKNKIAKLESESEEYKTIAAALGKDGIQALLIEDAIPEIEQEANELLSRLTDNQAQVFIESLRDLKSGGTRETLDIKISDSAGIRPYEMFSGGEAFRIDFALRIAISKLLARRAGTSLQTLVIDEGFGSQDEEGLNHIMEAIYKIQEDFAKVIIVSHLPSMKDQFPVHFIVEKGPAGSRVKVLEQG